MSLKLASDLVNDVLRAADPGRVKVAKQKLASARISADFGVVLRTADRGHARVRDLAGDMISDVLGAASPDAAQAGYQRLAVGGADVNLKLEAFMLGRSFETLLPKNQSGIFGDKIAGDMWRSLLADELGKSLAGAGGIGIAGLIRQGGDGEDGENAGAAKDPAPASSWPYFRHLPYLSEVS
jgi:peptidoglycan hydrolase FlgJ